MPVEISMERAATRLDMLWGVLNWALKAKASERDTSVL